MAAHGPVAEAERQNQRIVVGHGDEGVAHGAVDVGAVARVEAARRVVLGVEDDRALEDVDELLAVVAAQLLEGGEVPCLDAHDERDHALRGELGRVDLVVVLLGREPVAHAGAGDRSTARREGRALGVEQLLEAQAEALGELDHRVERECDLLILRLRQGRDGDAGEFAHGLQRPAVLLTDLGQTFPELDALASHRLSPPLFGLHRRARAVAAASPRLAAGARAAMIPRPTGESECLAMVKALPGSRPPSRRIAPCPLRRAPVRPRRPSPTRSGTRSGASRSAA